MKEVNLFLKMALLMCATLVICTIWGLLGPIDSYLKISSTICFVATLQMAILIGKIKSE